MDDFSDSLLFDGDLAMEGFSTEEIDEFITTLAPDVLVPEVEYEWSSFSQAPVQEWASMLSNDEMDVVYGEPAEAIVGQDPDGSIPTIFEGSTQVVTGNLSSALRPMQLKSRHRIKASEWEQKRELIAVLYIDQEKTLAETRQTLLEEHGFYASEKAYKDKLKEWKMVKNLKLRQVKFMLKIAKKRKEEEGKETIFSCNGREVPGVKLQRYGAAVSVSSIITSFPSLVTYHTPRIHAPPQTSLGGYRRVKSLNVDSKSPTESAADADGSYGKLQTLNQKHLMDSLLDIQREHSKSHSLTDCRATCIMKFYGSITALFDEFTNILIRNKPSHILDIISFDQLDSILEDLQTTVLWKKHYIFGLPILQWQAKCLLALGLYLRCETRLEKVLCEYSFLTDVKSIEKMRLEKVLCEYSFLTDIKSIETMRNIFWPTRYLLAKAYLAQGKLYSIANLLENLFMDVKETVAMEIETLWSLKLYLTYRVLQMKCAGRASRKTFETLLHSQAYTMVGYLVDLELQSRERSQELDETRSMLVSLYTGLFRHKQFRKSADLRKVMIEMESIVLIITSSSELQLSANSLLQSYLHLGMRKEADTFRRKWSNIAELDAADHLLSGVSPQITDYVRGWLRTTWPYVELPSIQESLGIFGDIYHPL